eukprot:TCONS_00008636-protein
MFGKVTSLVLNDNDLPKPPKLSLDNIQQLLLVKVDDTNDADSLNKSSKDEDSQSIQKQRDKNWYKTTSAHVKTILQNVLPVLILHNNPKTRLALVDFVGTLLNKCLLALKDSIPILMDSLAKFLSDDIDEVKMKSQHLLEQVKDDFKTKGSLDMTGILQNKLHSMFLSLPRIMHSGNDDVKEAHLNIIKGYLIIFGDSFEDFLSSSSHLKTFFSALLQILEFDTNDVTLVEEKTQFSHLSLTNQSYDGKQNNDFTESKKYFKYFSSKNIRLAVNDIIHQMVKNCSIDVIIDHLIGECIEDHRWKLQTIFVLNEVIKSSQQLKDFNAEPYIDQISSIYLQDHLWRVPISNQYLQFIETRQEQKDEAKNSVTFESLSLTDIDKPQNEPFSYKNSLTLPFETINHNIQLICLLLEGFSTHSYILRTNYNIHLIKTLYPILEKVGSTNATINKTALRTLNNLSMYCNYDSLSDLILFNSDYLINAVTLQFRHMMIDSAAPAVLAVILRLCDKDIMPIVCDSAADVFRLLDEYQEEIAIQMLEVLKQFALAVNKWFCSEQNETGSNVD